MTNFHSLIKENCLALYIITVKKNTYFFLLDHLGKIRVLMRRDKTLKICANHFVQPWMLLEAMKGSDRAWMWMVQADYAGSSNKFLTYFISHV